MGEIDTKIGKILNVNTSGAAIGGVKRREETTREDMNMNYSNEFYNATQESLKGSEPFFKQQVLDSLNSINSNTNIFTLNDPEKYLMRLLQEISELQDVSNIIFTKALELVAQKELDELQPGNAFLNTSFVITGAVGTGKSHRLIKFAKRLMQYGKSVIFITQELTAIENLLVLAESTDYLIIDEAFLVLRGDLQPDLIKSLIQRTNLILSTQSKGSLEMLPGFNMRDFNYHLHLVNREEIVIKTPEFPIVME